jgi:hypothetical protein
VIFLYVTTWHDPTVRYLPAKKNRIVSIKWLDRHGLLDNKASLESRQALADGQYWLPRNIEFDFESTSRNLYNAVFKRIPRRTQSSYIPVQ